MNTKATTKKTNANTTAGKTLKKAKAVVAKKPKSKMDLCRSVFSVEKTRQENLAAFMKKSKCSPACASTYYATIKNEI